MAAKDYQLPPVEERWTGPGFPIRTKFASAINLFNRHVRVLLHKIGHNAAAKRPAKGKIVPPLLAWLAWFLLVNCWRLTST